MVRNLSEKQAASAAYIVTQLTPLPDEAAMNTRVAEIHLEEGRGPGPDCGCGICVAQYGPLGDEVENAAPPSEVEK